MKKCRRVMRLWLERESLEGLVSRWVLSVSTVPELISRLARVVPALPQKGKAGAFDVGLALERRERLPDIDNWLATLARGLDAVGCAAGRTVHPRRMCWAIAPMKSMNS